MIKKILSGSLSQDGRPAMSRSVPLKGLSRLSMDYPDQL